MSGTDSQSIRDQAAAWSARMMRSDADDHRAELEAWLAGDGTHRDAYERIMRRYDRAGILAWSGLRKPTARPRLWQRLGMVELTLLGIAGGLGSTAVMIAAVSTAIHAVENLTEKPRPGAGAERARLADRKAYRVGTRTGEIQSFTLPDGSKVVLDTNARLAVAFGANERRLTLSSGRARFEVAHEKRPFVVAAGNGEITARGTIFDVDTSNRGQVQVALLRGAIDVDVREGTNRVRVVKRLSVNEQTAYTPSGFSVPIQRISAAKADWPSGVLDVEGTPLTSLLAQANRYAVVPLTAGSPDIGALKVSGRFRIDQPDMLARNLADLFGLTINHDQPDKIVLARKM
ncbi:transmembrane sensor [Sphingomonas sp. SORGH_AS 950]|uniref:FecR family protein n=1 Tax=Sphingomonas sp. SORGH_AS_0950 TaxID=3041792 RepID=UPI00277E4374|nr:FecR domain-containing protein [Sphingomonas sp. SORGH_AS_0950]MDQ1158934.1 transmembrane sensor [Sphingomonas sp. SORGH_AS_0950]